jgi:hypothetical protein
MIENQNPTVSASLQDAGGNAGDLCLVNLGTQQIDR